MTKKTDIEKRDATMAGIGAHLMVLPLIIILFYETYSSFSEGYYANGLFGIWGIIIFAFGITWLRMKYADSQKENNND